MVITAGDAEDRHNFHVSLWLRTCLHEHVYVLFEKDMLLENMFIHSRTQYCSSSLEHWFALIPATRIKKR